MYLVLGILAGLAILQNIWGLIEGIRASRYMKTFRPQPVMDERVVVFCPCKGVDPGFESNVRSILTQDHSNYEACFVVESENDPAYSVLRALSADVLVAGRSTSRGQKVHNLAYAVGQRAAADIYVFCDSDARFPVNWLRKLVAPLNAQTIATGYRWYVPEGHHFPTLMRSAWNASVVSLLGDHGRNFAWGGSTAMRRETFDRIGVSEAWRGSVSDDYSITRAAQETGTRIVFVPECLIPSHGKCSLRDLLEFTTRQILITRIYHRGLWQASFVTNVVTNIAFWSSLLVYPALWAVLYALLGTKNWVRYRAVQTVLPGETPGRLLWFYVLSPPVVALLFLFNMIASMLTDEIVWRNIRYKLISPRETRVLTGF